MDEWMDGYDTQIANNNIILLVVVIYMTLIRMHEIHYNKKSHTGRKPIFHACRKSSKVYNEIPCYIFLHLYIPSTFSTTPYQYSVAIYN